MRPCLLKYKSKKNSWIKSLKHKNLAPIIKILKHCKDHKDVALWEITLIKEWRSKTKLLNMTEGGTGGDTGGGQKRRRAIISINTKTLKEKKYNFIHDAVKDGFCPSKIVAVCKRKRLSHKGHKFKYADETDYNQKVSKCTRPTIVQNKLTNIIQTFETRKEAIKYLGICLKTLYSWANKGNHKYKITL